MSILNGSLHNLRLSVVGVFEVRELGLFKNEHGPQQADELVWVPHHAFMHPRSSLGAQPLHNFKWATTYRRLDMSQQLNSLIYDISNILSSTSCRLRSEHPSGLPPLIWSPKSTSSFNVYTGEFIWAACGEAGAVPSSCINTLSAFITMSACVASPCGASHPPAMKTQRFDSMARARVQDWKGLSF